MIYFIGDKPSKRNVDPKVAFVGTTSYKTLLEWIYRMNLSVNDIMLYNAKAFIQDVQDEVNEDDFVVALGREASTLLEHYHIPHHKIPHPSGLNRMLNDKKQVNEFLKGCKEYVNT